MEEFKLSASVKAHDDDVRAVSFPRPDLVLSASRDASVRVWKLPEPDTTISSTGNAFMTSVAFLPPSPEYPNGLVVSGSQDAIIDVRELRKPPDANAERLLIGHSHNVCALDISPNGKWIVSGSWDQTARLWEVGKWSDEIVLEGHKGSVWSVLAYSDEMIITACADHMIRVFSNTGKQIRQFEASKDVVRALCKLKQPNPLGADFASAGNDGIIRFWNIKGSHIAQLNGHESFIYSLACLPNGDIVSSGEDRTVRIWRQTNCIQTITHPAISVWCVAVNQETSDIVTGASDRTVRVFTREEKRVADAETLAAFDEAVKGSAIPQQQVGDINKEKLPGPDFLKTKIGTKEGQVVMIREDNGSVTAHTWSSGAQEWVNVGTVVDSAGSSGNKQEYLGKDYDYVFDVDIEDGKPALKLPYNISQNPYEAATKFIEDNELSMNYLDEVANFITTNTRGTALGQQSSSQEQPNAPSGSDPWGTESRYRPGDSNEVRPPSEPARPKKVLPQKEYLAITSANVKTVVKKIGEFNEQLLQNGPKDACLNPGQVERIQALGAALEKGGTAASSAADAQTIDTVLSAVQTWPPAQRVPVLDLLRLLVAAAPATATPDLLAALERSGSLADTERPNNQMLGCRTLANLFQTPAGITLAGSEFTQIHALARPLAAQPPANRNVTIALATLYINFAVLLASSDDVAGATERAMLLQEDLCGVLKREKDSEGIYRCLVALGTLLSLGPEACEAAGLFGIQEALTRAGSGVKEPRIRNVIAEIRELMR